MSKHHKDTTPEKSAATGKKLEMTPAEKAAVTPAAFKVRQAHLSKKRGISRDVSENKGRGKELELEPCSRSPEMQAAMVEMVDPWEALHADATPPNTPLNTLGFSPQAHVRGFKRKLADIIEKQRRAKQAPAPTGAKPLPATWAEFREKHPSITHIETAGYLQCKNTKTVRRLVKDRELRQSAKKRIICDEQLRNQIRKVHGPHVLL